MSSRFRLLMLLSAIFLVTATAASSAQQHQALPRFRYSNLELTSLPVSGQVDSEPSSAGQQLTLMQLNQCLLLLQSKCQVAGYDDIPRVAGPTEGSSVIDPDGAQLELETRLQQPLRKTLFEAHRSDKPNERLAVCLLVQTSNIFDQWRPRSDPICLTLQGTTFRPATSIPEGQGILCAPSESEYSRVFVVCSRSLSSEDIKADNKLASSRESAVVNQQKRPPARGLSVSGTDAGAVSRIVCAIVWALTIALSIVAMLVAGTLLNAAFRRRRNGINGSRTGISDNAVAPSGDEILSKGSLIVVTATADEVAGMSASIGLRDCDCIDFENCPATSIADCNYNEEDLETHERDPHARHHSAESRL